MQTRLTFIGVDCEVTGSCHFLKVGNTKVFIDCDMEQGNNIYQNAEPPVGYHEIDYVLLVHVHIDYVDMLPWIHARGFRGQIITTYTTADLCSIMLKDSTHIQETKAEWKNRRTRRASRGEAETLYTMRDVEDMPKHFEGVAYGRVFKLDNSLALRFTGVGYLLGSAPTEIWATEGVSKKKIIFFGDTENKNKSLTCDPQYITRADYAVMESAYENRYHREDVNHVDSPARTIQETPDRQGNVVIPTSAVGRIRELLYLIHHIKEEGFIAGHDSFEVCVDSPLVVEATHTFKDNMLECYDEETKTLVGCGINPIDFPGLELSVTSEESKNISSDMTPKVTTSAADMYGADHIRHHLKHNLWRPECFVVFTGYQAERTLGRTLQDGAQTVKILGEEIDVRVHTETMDGISGHTDRDGLISWISALEKKPDYVFMVHGNEESCVSFSDVLNIQLKLMARAPFSGPQLDLIKGLWIKEAEGVLIKKEVAIKRRASGVYTRLVNTGKILLDVIHRNEGGANKDLTRFMEQILALCDKWDRQNITDRRY